MATIQQQQSSQKTIIDQLVGDNEKLRQEIYELRKEKEDLNRNFRKAEG